MAAGPGIRDFCFISTINHFVAKAEKKGGIILGPTTKTEKTPAPCRDEKKNIEWLGLSGLRYL